MGPSLELSRVRSRLVRRRGGRIGRFWPVLLCYFGLCVGAGVWLGGRVSGPAPVAEAGDAPPPVVTHPAALAEPMPHIALDGPGGLVDVAQGSGEAPLWDDRLTAGGGYAVRRLGTLPSGRVRAEVGGPATGGWRGEVSGPVTGGWRAEVVMVRGGEQPLSVGVLHAGQTAWEADVMPGTELYLKVRSAGGPAPTLTWQFHAGPDPLKLKVVQGGGGEGLPLIWFEGILGQGYSFGQRLWPAAAGSGYVLTTAGVAEAGYYTVTAAGAESGWQVELAALGPDGEVQESLATLTPWQPTSGIYLDPSERVLLKVQGQGSADLTALHVDATPDASRPPER